MLNYRKLCLIKIFMFFFVLTFNNFLHASCKICGKLRDILTTYFVWCISCVYKISLEIFKQIVSTEAKMWFASNELSIFVEKSRMKVVKNIVSNWFLVLRREPKGFVQVRSSIYSTQILMLVTVLEPACASLLWTIH